MKKKWDIWVKRPVLWFLAVYAAGIVFSICFPVKPIYLLPVMTAIAAAGVLFRKKALFHILLALILLFGCLRGAVFKERSNPLAPFSGMEISLQGVVTGAPQIEEDRAIYVIQSTAVKVDDLIYPIRTRIKVSVYPDAFGKETKIHNTYKTGDLLQVTGTVKEPSGPRNPKGFDYGSYLKRRGIYNIVSAKERNTALIGKGSSLSLDRILAMFRDGSSEVLEQAVGGREGNFLKAVLLGQRWLIEPESEDAFTRTGLAHILAISGLHIGYLVVLLSIIQSVLRLRKGTALLFQAVILIFYCLMTGASPSVVRAVIMSLIYLTGKALGRKSDLINSIATAAFLILLIRPMDIQEISFQLSFISVCSIALLHQPIQKAFKFLPKKISSLIAAGLSAQLGTLPLTAYYFNLVSPVSVLANILVLPVLGVVTAGGFLLILSGMVFLPAAAIAAIPIRFLCRLIFMVTDFAMGLPFSFFRVVSPSVFAIIIAYLLLWIISRERPAFIRHPSLVCMMLIAVFLAGKLLSGLTAPRELKIVFLDVGQGDCCFIQTPDGKNILLDGGGQAGTEVGEDILLPFLLKNGIASLDLVVMSHGHDDHISGLLCVLDQLKTAAFMEYPPGEASPVYLELKKIVSEKGIQVFMADKGQSYCIGKETWLHVLYPEEKIASTLYQGNENNLSLVLLLECGDASVLFTGDIEKGVEYFLSKRMEKQACILKVPHHGSNSSSTEAFLDAVSPEAAVIQSGINFFGHPSPQTLERLEQRNIVVYRNDLHGAVMLNYRDGKWIIRTMI
ncbi:MAG TPA: DNA internalization-related competence protein ComEC/Rec2 [Clostridiales bacterium]|nr:DNA internalization-related competence protein ComEC/Rec2 [Clostridiales bacterium]